MLQEQKEKRFLNLPAVIMVLVKTFDRCQKYLGKGLTYAYRDRKNNKRNFRALWIQRINAAARLEGMSYSKLMGALHKAGIEINRKVLADLAMNNPEAFKAIVEKVK